jgi:hypothetical protein
MKPERYPVTKKMKNTHQNEILSMPDDGKEMVGGD